ncbi:manganese catalase family protein [Evansella sp. LMS18]|uniref:manganese catalase family protein n=1 Tax=Evansella sp. LMS18 TaxID=2924033 RepID=UPI0020D163E1|nr:manganese catalase family protein [Evansella sp. LMS18]UTR09119.1 manganese catalase family protein [Evansella sp. LMS18]
MFMRINKLPVNLPAPKKPDSDGASLVQELLGGQYGEMSLLHNYLFQSFNFRNKQKFRPFYELVSSMAAEELSHTELVSNTINLMLTGTTFPGDPDVTPMKEGKDKRNTQHFIAAGQTAMPVDSMGKAWSGENVFNSGNLVLDFLHNFYREWGARIRKMRIYEMTDHPAAREMIGYLLVRSEVHILAFSKALEIMTGAELNKLLPVPDIDTKKFSATEKYGAEGVHRKLYTYSAQNYTELAKIWKGRHPGDGGRLEVIPGTPEGVAVPDLDETPEAFAPGISHENFREIAMRLMRSSEI